VEGLDGAQGGGLEETVEDGTVRILLCAYVPINKASFETRQRRGEEDLW
jgi:hypothetical protein